MGTVSEQNARIAVALARFQDRELDAHYLGFFECFNRQICYEAVLEPLWLEQRGRPEAALYKGLIQLAGAFVHLQKRRLPPAAALFRLAALPGLARRNVEFSCAVFASAGINS